MDPAEAAAAAAEAARVAKLREGYKQPVVHKLVGSARMQAHAAARLTAARTSASLKRRRVAADDGVKWEMGPEATEALMMEIAVSGRPAGPTVATPAATSRPPWPAAVRRRRCRRRCRRCGVCGGTWR